MKSTGIVRRIDDLGRIVIPKELRNTFDIDVNEPVEIYTEGEMIILKKYQPACVFCGEANDTRNLKGKIVCKSCLSDIKKYHK